MTLLEEHSVDYILTGGDCNAQSRMPITLLAQKVIEVATLHANILGIGYDDLYPQGRAWVLSRMSIEVVKFPRINDPYRITTWVPSFNRRFSERDFTITDAQGEVLAYVRTVWVIINIADRSMGDLSGLTGLEEIVDPHFAPIDPFPKLGVAPTTDGTGYEYEFAYSDLDANRHVNSVVYLRLMNNLWPLQHYDTHRIHRVDIAFMHEAYYGNAAAVTRYAKGDDLDEVLITSGDTTNARILVSWCDVEQH